MTGAHFVFPAPLTLVIFLRMEKVRSWLLLIPCRTDSWKDRTQGTTHTTQDTNYFLLSLPHFSLMQ